MNKRDIARRKWDNALSDRLDAEERELDADAMKGLKKGQAVSWFKFTLTMLLLITALYAILLTSANISMWVGPATNFTTEGENDGKPPRH